MRVFRVFFSSSLSFFIENITGRLYNIQNSKLCFRDMKIMSQRNGGDSVNNESAGFCLPKSPPFLKHSLLISIY